MLETLLPAPSAPDDLPAPGEPGAAWKGRVASVADGLEVIIADYDDTLRWRVGSRFRGPAPAVGECVLVVFDQDGDGWVVA